MPVPGKRWRLVTISTYGAWLPGDERGFRTRHHKIHSSGDYKHRPPAGEHAGLHRYAQRISGPAVIIPKASRRAVGLALIAKLSKLDHRLLAVSVSGMHAHLVVELPDDVKAIRKVLGECKTVASHAIRNVLPGRVWGRDGDYEPLDDARHHLEGYRYVLKQHGAWVWSFKGWERANPPQPKNPRASKTRPRGLGS